MSAELVTTATDLCAACTLIELVGPKGYEHGFICVDPAKCGHRGGGAASTAGRTRRLSGRDVRTVKSGTGTMTMSERADRATAKLTGRKASDYQHLAAARLHSEVARRGSVSKGRKAYHTRMASMHRGIANRTPGRGTRSAARPSGGGGKPAAKLMPGEANARAAVAGELRRKNVFTAGPEAAHAAKQSNASLPALHANAPIGSKMKRAASAELKARGIGRAAPVRSETKGYGRLPTGKAALTTAGRKQAHQAGHALSPAGPGQAPGYPVTDAKSWENARKAVGRVKSPARREELRSLLRKTAGRYGKTKALKASWAASNEPGPALEFAMADRYPKLAVTSPYDVLITRGEDGQAVLRHRRGGYEIARIRRDPDGSWIAAVSGRDLGPHVRQRAALMEAIGVHNAASGTPQHRPQPQVVRAEPLQPPPVQTDLMRAYGIPAIRALATPTRGASDGPRVSGGDVTALGQRGKTIYGKLRKRGFPHERAHSFARRAQNRMGGK